MHDRFGVDVREGYGLTEASPIVATAALGGPARPGSIGPPLPGVEVRLVDRRDATAPTCSSAIPGEIWVRGPNVFAGYWNDPEATARVLDADGWLHTGDLAIVDDDGWLRLVDRAKDLIIVSGFNVYPAEVEDALVEHPDVAEAAVVGVADPKSGEAVVAFVVPCDGATPTWTRAHRASAAPARALQAAEPHRVRRRAPSQLRGQGAATRAARARRPRHRRRDREPRVDHRDPRRERRARTPGPCRPRPAQPAAREHERAERDQTRCRPRAATCPARASARSAPPTRSRRRARPSRPRRSRPRRARAGSTPKWSLPIGIPPSGAIAPWIGALSIDADREAREQDQPGLDPAPDLRAREEVHGAERRATARTARRRGGRRPETCPGPSRSTPRWRARPTRGRRGRGRSSRPVRAACGFRVKRTPVAWANTVAIAVARKARPATIVAKPTAPTLRIRSQGPTLGDVHASSDLEPGSTSWPFPPGGASPRRRSPACRSTTGPCSRSPTPTSGPSRPSGSPSSPGSTRPRCART